MMRSTKLQRLTAMAVPALLATNAMVLVLGVTVMDDAKPASADGTETETETATYITAADGTLQLVDATTPEGAKAIADANERGQQVVTASGGDGPTELQQQQARSTTPIAPPGVTNPVDDLLDQTESTLVDTLGQLGDTVDGVVDGLTDTIDDAAGTNLGDILDPAVDEGTDTLTTTVSTIAGGARNTATTVVTTATPIVTTPPAASAPAPAPEPIAEVAPGADAPAVPVDAPLGL